MEQIKHDWDNIVRAIDMASKAGVFDIHQAGVVSNSIERLYQVINKDIIIPGEKLSETKESKNVSKK